LDHAIKYTRKVVSVNIPVVEKDATDIQFSVKDNSTGVPQEDLFRIFERFHRVDKEGVKELAGTGLRLSIVKHLIQAHGGRVE
jgi:two-component system phosphate regulon sensor histidine kinase PhoR